MSEFDGNSDWHAASLLRKSKEQRKWRECVYILEGSPRVGLHSQRRVNLLEGLASRKRIGGFRTRERCNTPYIYSLGSVFIPVIAHSNSPGSSNTRYSQPFPPILLDLPTTTIPAVAGQQYPRVSASPLLRQSVQRKYARSELEDERMTEHEIVNLQGGGGDEWWEEPVKFLAYRGPTG